MEFQIVKSYTNHNHLSIGLPLLASEVDEGSDLVHSAVGQCNRVGHVVGNGHWGVMDEGGGGVVDGMVDRGNHSGTVVENLAHQDRYREYKNCCNLGVEKVTH